jgi:hypothetical protein
VKRSFILGIIGGILAILISVYVLSWVGGMLGITGGAMGKKWGGALMIIGSMLAFFYGSSIFAVFPFILLLAGGILALREKAPLPAKTGGKG